MLGNIILRLEKTVSAFFTVVGYGRKNRGRVYKINLKIYGERIKTEFIYNNSSNWTG